MSYLFYYEFEDNNYGVIKIDDELGVMEVAPLSYKGENEKIETDWLQEKIENHEIDLSHNPPDQE